VAFTDACPHRLVPLSAGTVVEGRLRCAYHGWEFDADGRCAVLPSLGRAANLPPRARLQPVAAVRESGGRVLVRLARPEVAPDPMRMVTNVDPGLRLAWHPVLLAQECGDEPVDVTVLGATYRIRRATVGGPTADAGPGDPRPAGLCERWGLIWLAPDPPLVDLFDDPDAEDEAYVGAWLPPVRTPASAGAVADNFLDVAHFPFVHAATFGAGEEKEVPAYRVDLEPDGFRSVQEQWFDNPEDPGVRAGLRPVRQRRRATYIYRAPFQLMLRLEELDAGAVKTILFFSQPEHLTSTRIYTKMLLYGIGGVDRPGPETVAREVAFEEAVLGEDLVLQAAMTLPGLPLDPPDELHVRADRLGVALRRALDSFLRRTVRP
jgi:phenylpropionate dioxygenase-like ring-hydroxylating dioxygenase large terminal subunit